MSNTFVLFISLLWSCPKITWFWKVNQWKSRLYLKSIIFFSTTKLDEILKTKFSSFLLCGIWQRLSNLLNTDFFLHFLSQFKQVGLVNISFAILINSFKDSHQIILSIFFVGFCGHKFDEFPEIDLSTVISIEHGHSHVYKLSSWVVPAKLSDAFSQVQRR
jgi:hypothetical protein